MENKGIYMKKFDILYNCICLDNSSNEIWFDKSTIFTKKLLIVDISCDYTKPNNFGGIRLSEKNGINVNQIRLDDLSFDKLNLMKIDVETMEINVLNVQKSRLYRDLIAWLKKQPIWNLLKLTIQNTITRW